MPGVSGRVVYVNYLAVGVAHNGAVVSWGLAGSLKSETLHLAPDPPPQRGWVVNIITDTCALVCLSMYVGVCGLQAMWLMLQRESPEDFVVATGETHSVREMVELAFSEIGMEIV